MQAVGAALVPLPVVVAAGVIARMVGITLGSIAVLPDVPPRVRLALAAALAAVAIPMAIRAPRDEASPPAWPARTAVLVAAGEVLVGAALGAALAAIASAGAWAGGILGSVAGLSWADDFDPEGDAQAAGMARFAWWLSCGVFLAAGGLETIVTGVLDSVRVLPVGTLLPPEGMPRGDVGRAMGALPATALSLAIALAVPALLAVVAFHVTTAIALRTIPFAAGPGLLQSLAAVVLLGAIFIGAEAWVQGFPALVEGPIERIFNVP